VFKFAEIVEVDGEQVLFYTEPDEDDDFGKLHQIVQIEGTCMDAAASIPIDKLDEVFEKIDETFAAKFLVAARDLLGPALKKDA
jgi:hypothetical protein